MIHRIVPGILEKEWEAIEKKIELVLPFADTIHIDFIDGKFVNNTTFSNPKPFAKYTKKATFELHMMVNDPIQYLKPWAEAGFRRFYGHVEQMKDQAEFIAQGQLLGEVGLALDGPTGVDAIKVPISDLDCCLVYTSKKVGFSGPPFQNERLEKVKQLRKNSEDLLIEIDGGVSDETLPFGVKAGASHFVSTSFLYTRGEPSKQYGLLHQVLKSSLV